MKKISPTFSGSKSSQRQQETGSKPKYSLKQQNHRLFLELN